MDKISNRRKNYFIEKKFQAVFILKFCSLVALGGILTIGILYFLAMQSTTVSIVDSRVIVRTTADSILPLVIQTVIIVMAAIGVAAVIMVLLISHKIAGPLYHFKKALLTLEAGDFSSDIHLRHLDQFQGLADAFNGVIKKIRQQLNLLKNNLAAFKTKVSDISENEISESKRSTLEELKKLSDDLNKLINFFKS